MLEEKKSFLYKLYPISKRLPAIKKPEVHVHFKTKLFWTIFILIVYFVLSNIIIFGIKKEAVLDIFASFRAIMAGQSGSILHLGIGPIVTASIIMQLFVGAKIININLADPQDRAVYQSTQKLLVIIMIFVEGVPQVFGYLEPSGDLIAKTGLFGARSIIIGQLFIGSYLIFLMDEVISKWGIGSGISLFIAAGVSQAIITGTINWQLADTTLPASVGGMLQSPNLPIGVIPKTFYILQHMPARDFVTRGYEMIFLGYPNPIVGLIGVLIIFFIVVYTESSRIELPLTHQKVRGAVGKYPLRLIYVSNIPVILMAALLANIQMFAILFWTNPTLQKIPLLGRQCWLGAYPEGSTDPSMGVAYYTSTVRGLHDWLLPLLDMERYGGLVPDKTHIQIIFRVIIFVSLMVIGSIFFGKFWVETTGMSSSDVAKQIHLQGMRIPGFRADQTALANVLEQYIGPITIFSAAFVGFLAAFADLIGTVGGTSGTGVLLTVGIIVNFYELMAREQLMEMHPVIRKFFIE